MGLLDLLSEAIAFAGCLFIFYITLNVIVSFAKKAMQVKMPQMKNDAFLKENGYSWSFVFVYKVFDEDQKVSLTSDQLKFSMKNVIERLNTAGFDTSCFYSCQRDEVYVKVRANPDMLLAEAGKLDYKLEMDENRLRIRAQMGKKQGKLQIWAPISLTDEFKQSKYSPYQYIYGPYNKRSDLQSLYKEEGKGKAKMLKNVDMIKLMKSIFENPLSENGANLNLEKMIHNKCLEAAFALHDYNQLQELQEEWLQLLAWPSAQPFLKIRNYFGEKMALYYVFLGNYTEYLALPSIIGIGIYISWLFIKVDYEAPSLPFFALYMTAWSTYFTEKWKGIQARYAMEWGVCGFEEEEQDRPTYTGIQIKSPIDGSDITYFPAKDASRRKNLVNTIILSSILAVLGTVICIFAFQVWVNRPANKEMLTFGGFALGGPIYSIVNAVVIIVLNTTYTKIAIQLNDYENHKTETQYEDNLISKVFVFQIVNSYASLTYISFIKANVGYQCLNNSCTSEVSGTLSTLFISRLLTANITGILLPNLKVRSKAKEESQGLEPGKFPTPIEKQYALDQYDIVTTLLTEYAALVIQFGYVTLFVATWPLSPLMAYVSNYISIRVGAWKLCQIYRRPEPRTAEDIGTWLDMLEVMSTLAVIYNLGLVFFTGAYFKDLQWTTRWALFLLLEHVVFLIKYVIGVIIPDVPADVEMQLARQDFLMDKIIFDKADDIDEDFEPSGAKANFNIFETDGDWEADDEDKGFEDEEKDDSLL